MQQQRSLFQCGMRRVSTAAESAAVMPIRRAAFLVELEQQEEEQQQLLKQQALQGAVKRRIRHLSAARSKKHQVKFSDLIDLAQSDAAAPTGAAAAGPRGKYGPKNGKGWQDYHRDMALASFDRRGGRRVMSSGPSGDSVAWKGLAADSSTAITTGPTLRPLSAGLRRSCRILPVSRQRRAGQPTRFG